MDDAAFNVFTRRDEKIRHFFGGEMNDPKPNYSRSCARGHAVNHVSP
jgi:hypothetical protein